MESDSNIIHYTTWSISNNNYDSRSSSSIDPSETNIKNTSIKSIKTKLIKEFKSFCCFCFFFTCKSFKFHSVLIYLILLSLISLFTQMIQGGYMSAIMTNLQTHFNLSTSKIGLILSSYDIMAVFATPLVSYIGSKYNKCRVIGICGIFYVFGAVIYTLPYFLSEKYKIKLLNSNNEVNNTNIINIDYCKDNFFKSSTKQTTVGIESNYSTSSSSLIYTSLITTPIPISCSRDFSTTWPYAVFIIAQLFMSFGAAPLFSLGITYLCDNIEERLHAFYTGFVYGASALGPAIGYLSASFFLSKWLYLNEQAPVTERDPRWVGAWFFGFLIAAGLVFIVSILLISFPDALTQTNKTKRKLRKEAKRLKKTKNIAETDLSKDLNDKTKSNLNANNTNINNLNQRRVLHTIDEANELVDKNFEFLDSVSTNAPYSQLNSNLDSISTISFSNSTIHSNFVSNSPLPSLELSENSNTINKNNNSKHSDKLNKIKKPSCSQKLIDKIKHSRLKFRGFLASFLKLILNLRYTLLILIMSIECILVALFSNYMILYTQNVYQMSSSASSIIVGGVIVPSAILGTILGGFIVRKFNLYIEGCVRLIIISSCVVIAGIFVLLFIRCEGTNSTGINLDTQSFNTSFVTCNINCNCQSIYSPTCGKDNITYVNPCYAGCKFINSTGYYDCSCVNYNRDMNSNNYDINNRTLDAVAGSCSRKCETKLIIFLIVLFIVVAFEALMLTPATMLILKLIDKPLQPFALGLLRCANILIAYIPAPIVLAQIIDKTCILWNNECIGDKGTCLEYNIYEFHFVLFGTAAGIKIVSCIFLIIFSLYIHKSFILRRKYRNKATLNHDPTSILTPKQKYRIDSIIASSETSSLNSDDTASLRTLYRKSVDKIKKPSDNEQVVLKRHVLYEEDFTSIGGRSQTPDYYANIDYLQNSINSNRTNTNNNQSDNLNLSSIMQISNLNRNNDDNNNNNNNDKIKETS